MIRSKLSWFENARRLAGVFACCCAVTGLSGCALILPQTTALDRDRPEGLPEKVELAEVPFFAQEDYQCGPAALAMSLAYFRPGVTADQLVDQVYLPARQGSLQVEMLAAARRHGMVSYQLAPQFEDVLREVAGGLPVVVLQDYGVWPLSIWHYAVVIGYDYPHLEVILHSGQNRRLTMPFGVLEYTWKESDYWAMVAAPPDRVPATATESRYLAAVNALERTGNARAANTAYTSALRRWPGNLAALIGLGNTHHALGELDQAETALRKALGIEPKSVIVLNNLAQTLSDRGHYEEALNFADSAIALNGPLSPAARQTREEILQRLSRAR